MSTSILRQSQTAKMPQLLQRYSLLVREEKVPWRGPGDRVTLTSSFDLRQASTSLLRKADPSVPSGKGPSPRLASPRHHHHTVARALPSRSKPTYNVLQYKSPSRRLGAKKALKLRIRLAAGFPLA